MKAKRALRVIGRVAVSGALAFLALTAFCLLYYNVPSHTENADGSTDFKWEPGVFYSRGTEGFASGRTNNEGFVNTFDYNDDTHIDVLIMGSSQMEGFNVSENETTAARLDEMLGGGTAYNIGISSHTFSMCCGNLEAALEKYRPSYVVIETGTCVFSERSLQAVIDGAVKDLDSKAGGLLGLLQRNQYLRLLYSQFTNYRDKAANAPVDADEMPKGSIINDAGLLSLLLKKISDTARAHGSTLVILYHPGTALAQDGSLELTGSEDAASQFAELCPEYGIIFLDMSERFISEYERGYILPYGFANTPVGSGHLNKYGHEMIAEELYKIVSEAS